MARILIVDDEPDTVRILCLALQVLGHQAQGVCSGAQALEALAASLPDAVLLDIMMPEMDGFETLRRIRGMPSVNGLPVLFVTASAEADLGLRGAAAGAQGVLHKPVDLHTLGSWIDGLRSQLPISEGTLRAAS
ncbi:MAG: response regulator [Anaerolineales bacterium]|nr:response regulator [Anaerolineales bacterium]